MEFSPLQNHTWTSDVTGVGSFTPLLLVMRQWKATKVRLLFYAPEAWNEKRLRGICKVSFQKSARFSLSPKLWALYIVPHLAPCSAALEKIMSYPLRYLLVSRSQMIPRRFDDSQPPGVLKVDTSGCSAPMPRFPATQSRAV